jgi:hypothetical protein
MTMLSSAGLNSPQFRSALSLAAVALAALAVSLLLAFASATVRPDANGDGARRTAVEGRFSAQAREKSAEKPIAAPAAQPPAVSTAERAAADQPPLLWALLAPWAFAADAIAVLGLAAVLIVRYNARRRRGARM